MCSTLSLDFDSLIFSAQSAQSNYLQGSKYHALVELLNLEKLISKLKCDLLAGDVQDDPILTNLLEMILAQDQNLISFPDLSSLTPNNVDQTQSATLELFQPNFTPDSQFLESAVYSPVIESPSTSTPKSAPEKRSNNSEFEVSDEDDGFQVPSLSNHTIESNKRLKTSSKKRQAKEKSPEFDPETIQRLDQLFLQFLCTVCSDLDAVDSQGEKLLVTYSDREITKSYETGYHIFKFRMKPFARSLQDHFHHSGITETVLPDRKFKEYLNQHKYISRFSDEGKKAKSKGAMVWIVKAKKNLVTGDWIFLECGGRRIGGEEPKKFVVVGEVYSYSPVVVDPNFQG
ncbi:hypothetical protein HK098_006263 [Nowakowskiella sp. JEL0407]|nr:hypothetical protein HK098_006263 [Nowakowskiella sp. JEL0407]